MNRFEYRQQSGAYRAYMRQVYAIGMTYEARPMNADHDAELAGMRASMAKLQPVAKPDGFDRAQARDGLLDLRWHRMEAARNIRKLRSQLADRLAQSAFNAAHGIAITAPYIVTDANLLGCIAATYADQRRRARGVTRWPLASLKWHESLLDIFMPLRAAA